MLSIHTIVSRHVLINEMDKSLPIKPGWDTTVGSPSRIANCFGAVFQLLFSVEWLQKVDDAKIIRDGLVVTRSFHNGIGTRVHAAGRNKW